jgi:hypothetical protein
MNLGRSTYRDLTCMRPDVANVADQISLLALSLYISYIIQFGGGSCKSCNTPKHDATLYYMNSCFHSFLPVWMGDRAYIHIFLNVM